MIKGWRNDPEWIRYYEERNAKRGQFALMRAKLEAEMKLEEIKRDMDDRLRDILDDRKNEHRGQRAERTAS